MVWGRLFRQRTEMRKRTQDVDEGAADPEGPRGQCRHRSSKKGDVPGAPRQACDSAPWCVGKLLACQGHGMGPTWVAELEWAVHLRRVYKRPTGAGQPMRQPRGGGRETGGG